MTLTYLEALEIVRPVERIRWLCSDDNPDVDGPNGREAYRRLMIRKASGQSPAPIPADDPVSLATMAGNATAAVVRVADAVVHREPLFVDSDVLADRKAKCETCDHLKGSKCNLCGCFYAMKIRLKTESCPDDPPQW